ncbi:Rib/alpha-like domain-containing protein [Lactobacillus sp.]|uniref:Rib/alpha-like domain-containing protein n=1 Tax=Lactobacillus sp. TaxID=1591 RepID=UPI003EF8EA56
MKVRKLVMMAAVGASFLAIGTPVSAKTRYLSGIEYGISAKQKAVTTKKMKVWKVKTGTCEANNYFSKAGYIKKGTTLYHSQWFMSTGGGWIVKSSKYKATKRTFYFVAASEKTKWFKNVAAKKKVAKKKTVKKLAKKTVKKPTKKTTKKVVKKPIKKVVKKTPKKVVKLTMAQKYQPQVTRQVVKLKWDEYFSSYDAKKYITNASAMPYDTDYEFLDKVDTEKSGMHTSRIKAEYQDGSSEIVGTVSFEVPQLQAEKYPFDVKNITVPYNGEIDIRKDIVTNAPGTLPNDPALVTQDTTDFEYCRADGNVLANDPDTSEPGTRSYYVKAFYPDGSTRVSKQFTIMVQQPDNQVYHPSLKALSFTFDTGTALQDWDSNKSEEKLIDPNQFLNNVNNLPNGTVIHLMGDLENQDNLDEEGTYNTYIEITYPDGTTTKTLGFSVIAK